MDAVYHDRGDRQRFVIEHNGNVYSCDFFVEPRHRLGNICQSKIIDLLNSKKQSDYEEHERKGGTCNAFNNFVKK